jgi:hypothetical protein
LRGLARDPSSSYLANRLPLAIVAYQQKDLRNKVEGPGDFAKYLVQHDFGDTDFIRISNKRYLTVAAIATEVVCLGL